MDQASTRTIDTKIKEYAASLPEDQRDDFAQDMWVLLLTIELPAGPALQAFLNLTLFRARENWQARKRFREPRIDSIDPNEVESPEVSPETVLEAEDALCEVIGALTLASFSEEEIRTVVEGLRDGLTQKDIALSLGRTPQGFNYHMQKVRAA